MSKNNKNRKNYGAGTQKQNNSNGVRTDNEASGTSEETKENLSESVSEDDILDLDSVLEEESLTDAKTTETKELSDTEAAPEPEEVSEAESVSEETNEAGNDSIFDQFTIDEETGEVLIPRATVGVALDSGKTEADTDLTNDEEELPILDLDFDFADEVNNEMPQPVDDPSTDELVSDIDEALAEQMAFTIDEQLESQENNSKNPEDEEDEDDSFLAPFLRFWKKVPKWCKGVLIGVFAFFLFLCFLVFTKPGRHMAVYMVTKFAAGRVTRPSIEPTMDPNFTLPPEPTEPLQNPTTKPSTSPTPEPTLAPVTPAPPAEPRHEEYVYNVLLIGEENLPYFSGSRSDSMMILSVNRKEKKLKLTSLMRDMYVQIPGRADDKLNAAYAYGGAKLLIQTIEQNLQIKIDSYVKVNFESFEWIIDRLGGVEVTLTEQEAQYLRTTNYITKKEYRNVVAGKQLMNGNQALGYCRVRYVPNINGSGSDFGRTERQRMVLNELFEKYKNSGLLNLVSIMNDCLPKVTTDMSEKDMRRVLEDVIDNKMFSLQTKRIPVAASFEDTRVNGMAVLVVRWEQNIKELHDFVFGAGEE